MSENEQQAKPFITSVRIERKGNHEHVTIWIRSQLVGELVMGPGDAERFGAVLGSRDGREWLSEADVDQLVQERSDRTRRRQAAVADVIDDPPPKQGERSPELDARLEAWADQHMRLTPAIAELAAGNELTRRGLDAELAAGNELTRRGLDLDAMNRGRARADMPTLTAVETLERIDAAAGALNDLRGLGFPPDLKVDPVEAARRIKRAVHAEADRDAGVDTRHLDGPSALKAATERAVAMGLINPDAFADAVAGASVTRDGDAVHVSIPAPVPSREQLQERLAQIRRLAVYHAQRDIDLTDRARFAQLVVDLCDADQLIGGEGERIFETGHR